LNKLRKEGVTEDDPTILAAILRSPFAKDWSDKKICIHMTTFLFAGHDTTMNSLTWLLYYLIKHPSVEQKVLDELHNLRKKVEQQERQEPEPEQEEGGGGRRIEMMKKKKKVELIVNEGLERLVYLRSVINETMRLRTR
jgi:cytochrome P450